MLRAVFRVLVALIVLGALLFGATEWKIRAIHHEELVQVPVPRDPASVAEGARLATLVGCQSCHGNGKGSVWTPVDYSFGQIAPPPIARSIAAYSDAELARLIRHGLHRDGTTAFVMPVQSMRYLSDDDVGRIIAWARSLRPAADDVKQKSWYGPLARWQMVTGEFPESFEVGTVSAPTRPADTGGYFVDTLCSECHTLQRPQVREGRKVPPLLEVVPAYSPADFKRLLRDGVGAGGRDVGFMGVIARENLHALSDEEIAAIHAYLQSEAAKLKE